MSQHWFSAMLRFVILTEGEGGSRLSRSVIVLRARDWQDARSRALTRSRSMKRGSAVGLGGPGLSAVDPSSASTLEARTRVDWIEEVANGER